MAIEPQILCEDPIELTVPGIPSSSKLGAEMERVLLFVPSYLITCFFLWHTLGFRMLCIL